MRDEQERMRREKSPITQPLMRVVSAISDVLAKPGFVLAVLVICISALILIFSAQNDDVPASLTFLMITLVFFAATIANEVITRRRWEENLSLYINRLENRLGNLSHEHDKTVQENKNLTIALSGLIHQIKGKATATEQRDLADILLQIQHQSRHNTTIIQKVPPEVKKAKVVTMPTKAYDLPSFDEEKQAPVSQKKQKIIETPKSDPTLGDLISTAIRQDSVDLFLQPIVRLPQRKTAFYEVYARLRASHGVHLDASRYLPQAKQDHLIPAIDNLLFMRVIQLMRRQKGNDNQSLAYFLNVNADTLNNSALMADLVEFLGDNRHLANKLVLEIAQSDFLSLSQSLWSVLKSLSQMGVRFSMDQVTQLDIDVARLTTDSISFVKIDSYLVLDTLSSKVGQRAFMNLKKDLDNAGVDLIIQKVEREENLKDILDYNIDFGQGYLFGEPEQSQKRAA